MQVLRLEFRKFRILEILNFHPCKYKLYMPYICLFLIIVNQYYSLKLTCRQLLLSLLFPHSIFQGKIHTVKPVLRGHTKIDKTKVFKTSGSLVQVHRSILKYLWCAGLENIFWGLLLSVRLRRVLLFFFFKNCELLLDGSFIQHRLTWVTVLCLRARHFIHCLVLVEPTKTGDRSDMPEKLLPGA